MDMNDCLGGLLITSVAAYSRMSCAPSYLYSLWGFLPVSAACRVLAAVCNLIQPKSGNAGRRRARCYWLAYLPRM
jgi:hypothetical protein